MVRRHRSSEQPDHAVDVAGEGVQPEPGGTLAEAIEAHLALKREHGADPEEVERQRRAALAPAEAELETAVEAPPPAREAPAPPAPESADTSMPVSPPDPDVDVARTEQAAAERDEQAEQTDSADAVSALAPESAARAGGDAAAAVPDPEELSENFEFEWGDAGRPERPAADLDDLSSSPLEQDDLSPSRSDPSDVPPSSPESTDADVLEQTPDFFEETPEYDRLWFEERPPRDFDF